MAAQFQVFGLVDYTHTTTPKFPEDAIVGYLLADHMSVGRRPAVIAVMLGRAPIPVNCHVLILLARQEADGRCAIFLFGTTILFFPKLISATSVGLMQANASTVWND